MTRKDNLPSKRALYDRGLIDVSASGWLAYPGADISFSTLEGDCSADVAVIGAGLAGSSLALHLAERGAQVSLIEAREPGWGASGRSAGHVVPHRDRWSAIERLPDRGERFLMLLRDHGDIVFTLARKHQINCDAVQSGYIQVVHRAPLLRVAERKARRWSQHGFRIRFVDREEVARLTGSEKFTAGVLDDVGGWVNPFHFTRGLALAAERAGAAVFSHSPVTMISREGAHWRVMTNRGAVGADIVVVCTNGYTGDFIPELARAWCPLVAYGLATQPLPEPLRSTILPSGVALSQFPTGSHPALVDGLGRLVTALLPGAWRPHHHAGPIGDLRRWLARNYPQAQNVHLEVEAYWTGAMAWSPDRLPRLFEVQPGLLALMSFSGEGNVLAPLLGKHLAEAIVSQALSQFVLPLQSPSKIRWRRRYDFTLRKVGVPLLRVADRFGLA